MQNPVDPPRLLTFRGLPMEVVDNLDMQGQMAARHVLGEGIAGTCGAIADYVELAPGLIHGMHRHPGADQILVPFTGVLTLRTEVGTEEVAPGSLGIAHRGVFHEIRNTTEGVVCALLMYLGASTMAEVGYQSRTEVVK